MDLLLLSQFNPEQRSFPLVCCVYCLQYDAPGFLKNVRQFRQFGFAAIELAQVLLLFLLLLGSLLQVSYRTSYFVIYISPRFLRPLCERRPFHVPSGGFCVAGVLRTLASCDLCAMRCACPDPAEAVGVQVRAVHPQPSLH